MNLSKLKVEVDKSGIPIREICRRVGITTPTYYKAIRDNDIMSGILEKFCKELKVVPCNFFDTVDYSADLDTHQQVAEDAIHYMAKKKDIHIGRLIEKRLDEINMSIAEFGRRINTTRQNALGIIGRKNITWEHAIQYNDILNPPGSQHWDIFEYFLRSKPETLQDKYIRLLEECNQLRKKQSKKEKK